MAQTFDAQPAQDPAKLPLMMEKVGVIGGFLLGGALSIGVVAPAIDLASRPDWLPIALIGLTVAVATRLGLSAARLASAQLNA